jgi:hypothetical protein
LVLEKSAEVTKAARDGVVGGVAFEIAKQPESLVSAVAAFLISASGSLHRLADALPATFGWVGWLLKLLGL